MIVIKVSDLKVFFFGFVFGVSTFPFYFNMNFDLEDPVYRKVYSRVIQRKMCKEAIPTAPMNKFIPSEELLKLEKSVRILCFVVTNPKNHKTKAITVKQTWGKRCNSLIFLSTQSDPELEPVLILSNTTEGRSTLWTKTNRAVQEIYKKYLNDADWFLKADDDTYVIMENLRYLLKDYDSNKSHYFGYIQDAKILGSEYMRGGGASFVLSKRTIQRLVEEAFILKDDSLCRRPDSADEKNEDFEIGKCLKTLNITRSDSRDEFGRLRFFSMEAEALVLSNKTSKNRNKWNSKSNKYPQTEGLEECCSDTTISFDYVEPRNMYVYELLLYRVRPYGILYNNTQKIK